MEHVRNTERCAVRPIPSEFNTTEELLRHWALQYARGQADTPPVVFIPTKQLFCGYLCPAVVQGLLVMRDHSHVSDAYAAFLGGELELLLRPFKPGMD